MQVILRLNLNYLWVTKVTPDNKVNEQDNLPRDPSCEVYFHEKVSWVEWRPVGGACLYTAEQGREGGSPIGSIPSQSNACESIEDASVDQ